MYPSNPDVAYFDRLAPLFDLAHPGADAAALRMGLSYAEREVDRVLDVGGGTGRAVRTLPTTDRVVVDAAAGMVNRARRHGLEAVQGDATRLPIATASTDAVLIVDALHHFPDPQATLAEIARILKPGGVAVVREFDRSTLRGKAVVGFEHLIGFDSTFFTPDELATMLSTAGLNAAIPERGFQYTVVGVCEDD